ncbi:MAG: hypothetical protein AAF217_04360 [Pseudomonadota bacterium]
MSTPKAKNFKETATFSTFGTAEFNRRVEEGMKQAPIERAKALKEFWGWIAGR